MQVAADDGNFSEEGGEGEGFVVGGVVQFGGQVRLGLAHAVKKPGMESDGILGKEGAGMLGVQGKLDAQQLAGRGPRGGADSHRLSLDADGLSICWIIGGLGHSRPDYSLVYSFEEGDRGRRLRRMGDDRLTSVVGWHPVA